MLNMLRRTRKHVPLTLFTDEDRAIAREFAGTFQIDPEKALADLEALSKDQAWADAVLGVYTAAEMDAARDVLEQTDDKRAEKILRKAKLEPGDVSRAVAQYWAERGIKADEDEPEEGGAETGTPTQPPAPSQHVERMAITIPETYKDAVDERAKLIAALWRKLGEGWQVESVDLQQLSAIIVRGELPAMRPGHVVHTLGARATAGTAEAVASEFAAAGQTMLDYNPYTGRAETAKLPPATVELRARLLRKLPKQKSWELELLPIFGVRDGVGHLARVVITRADTVSPERGKEVAHWLGLARTVIGHNGWWVKIDDTTGVVTMNAGIPLKVPARAPYDYDVIEMGKWGELVVGRDGYNKPVIVDLAATPHALVAGRTGSGKSIFLQTMIFSALAHGFELAILDPSKHGLDFRWARPYVRDGGWGCQSFPEALETIERVYAEAQRRLDILDRLDLPKWSALCEEDRIKYGIKPILVVVDEGTSMAKLISIPKTLEKDDPRYAEIAKLNSAKELLLMMTGKILRECRFVGVHIVFGTQRFGREEIGQGAGEMRENMGARIILGRTSTTSLAMAVADPQDAAEAYELAHGTATAESDNDPSLKGREATPGRGLAEIDGIGHVALQGAYAPVEELIERLEALSVPRYEGDRRPDMPEEDAAPFSFEVIETEEPAVPEVEELKEMELTLDDLEEESPEAPAEEPELDWSTSDLPAVALDRDEDPFEVTETKRVLADNDEDDPFDTPVKQRPKAPAFDW